MENLKLEPWEQLMYRNSRSNETKTRNTSGTQIPQSQGNAKNIKNSLSSEKKLRLPTIYFSPSTKQLNPSHSATKPILLTDNDFDEQGDYAVYLPSSKVKSLIEN